MSEKSKPSLVIEGDSNWWDRVMRAMMYSHEKNSRDSSTVSFMACMYFSMGDKHLIMAQSASSDTSVTITDDCPVEVTGEGHYLIPVATLNQHISAMPTGDIALSFYPEEGIAKITDDADTVEFTCGLVDIINDEMVPQAYSDFPDKAQTITVEGSELLDAYKTASTMGLPMEKDPLAGQDPMAGCYVTVTDKGIQIYSLASSAAESFIPNEGKRKKQTIITAPNTTLPRLGVFFGSDEVELSIDKNILHVDDGVFHMAITPLNIGERKSKISADKLLGVLNPAWEAGLVDATLPATEFFTALGRADSVGNSSVEMSITDTSVTLSSLPENGRVPFKQKMTCSTQWLEDEEHWASCKFHVDTVKSLSNTVGKRESLRFRLALKKNGDPWALMIIPDDFDVENPHNYHMISLMK